MQLSTGSARKRACKYFMMVAAGSLAGVLAGPAAPGEAQTKKLSPAQVVAFRFPTAWNSALAMPAPTASVTARQQAAGMFDPNPTYGLASADSRPALPELTMAYADPRSEVPAVEKVAAERPVTTAALPPPRPQPATAPSNVLLNDSQLANIKHRLRLSPDQQQYWPQVEAALRAISRRLGRTQSAVKPGEGMHAKIPNIDPNGPEVQQLKSAAIPLLMTMREDQKREVRALARLIGLNQIASQI